MSFAEIVPQTQDRAEQTGYAATLECSIYKKYMPLSSLTSPFTQKARSSSEMPSVSSAAAATEPFDPITMLNQPST